MASPSVPFCFGRHLHRSPPVSNACTSVRETKQIKQLMVAEQYPNGHVVAARRRIFAQMN